MTFKLGRVNKSLRLTDIKGQRDIYASQIDRGVTLTMAVANFPFLDVDKNFGTIAADTYVALNVNVDYNTGTITGSVFNDMINVRAGTGGSVNAGNGDDSVKIYASNMKVNDGDGNDTIAVVGSNTTVNLATNEWNGNDVIQFRKIGNAQGTTIYNFDCYKDSLVFEFKTAVTGQDGVLNYGVGMDLNTMKAKYQNFIDIVFAGGSNPNEFRIYQSVGGVMEPGFVTVFGLASQTAVPMIEKFRILGNFRSDSLLDL